MITEEQVKARTQSIGSSDAAAVLGLSRHKTRLAIWSEKTGTIIPPDISKNLAIRLGNRLEQVVAELFEEETGKKVRRANITKVHPDYPFLTANLDREIVGEDAILECKNAGERLYEEWADDEIPPEYIIQCMHQLAVTGKARCYIACLVGANKAFVWKIIDRDEDMIAELVQKEVTFWIENVLAKKMPDVAATDKETLFQIFPKSIEQEDTITLPTEAEALCASFDMAKKAEKMAGEEKETLGNKLRVLMGENAYAVVGKYKITWKNQSSFRVDMERLKSEAPEVYARFGADNPSRVLRVAEQKEKKAKGGN